MVCILLLTDRIRPEAPASVGKLRRAGIHVVMMTGDNRNTASAIAEACGILGRGVDRVVDHTELSAMTDAEVKAYADAHLEEKYVELRNLVHEYHDGILLFDVSLREVWDKANKDIVGLTAYFKANKKNYTWDEPRFKGFMIYAKDEVSAKAARQIAKSADKDSVISYINQRVNVDSVTYVRVEQGLWTAGKNGAVDKYAFKNKEAEYTPTEEYPIVVPVGKVIKAPQEYNDVRGQVTTDYQDYLETLWVAALREKYQPIIVHEEVLNELK